MIEVAITAGNILTSLGDVRTTWNKMIDGKSGLVRREKSRSDGVSPLYGSYPLGLIDGLDTGDSDGGSWRRLQAVLLLLLSDLPRLPEDTPIFFATTKAAVDELFHDGTAVEQGQPWQLAAFLKEHLQLSGKTITVSAACASGTIALIQAAMAIETGRCDRALVIGADLVGDFILTGFDSLKALSPDIARPFDRKRDGLSLGDGGGWLLLSSAKAVEKTGQVPLAWLGSWGISCDATHITAPCRHASGLKLALEQLMAKTTIPLGGINAHGTGTVYNDAMELLAYGQKFGPEIPICSVKGALGHTLGAAGVIEAMLSIESLQHMVLPPTVGLKDPENGAENLSGSQCLPLLAPSIISCNSGFGGINAAVYLYKPSSSALRG